MTAVDAPRLRVANKEYLKMSSSELNQDKTARQFIRFTKYFKILFFYHNFQVSVHLCGEYLRCSTGL